MADILIEQFFKLDNFDNTKEDRAEFYKVALQLSEKIPIELTDREKYTLEEYGKGKTFREIGVDLNVSGGRVCQIKHKAYRKIRKAVDKYSDELPKRNLRS